jgi:hypothetical protein
MVRFAVVLNIPMRFNEYVPGVARPAMNWCWGMGTTQLHDCSADMVNPR